MTTSLPTTCLRIVGRKEARIESERPFGFHNSFVRALEGQEQRPRIVSKVVVRIDRRRVVRAVSRKISGASVYGALRAAEGI